MRAAVIVAIGEKAEREALACSETALQHGAEKCFILKRKYGGVSDKQISRYAKTKLMEQGQDELVYLDADTRVTGDLSAGFQMIEDGWDMAIMPSGNQEGSDLLWHIKQPERDDTMLELGYVPLQLQAGVMFIWRNERTKAFFGEWWKEYIRYGDEDQAAFLRALNRVPLKLWLLGKPWNGGPVIQHRFGAFREN